MYCSENKDKSKCTGGSVDMEELVLQHHLIEKDEGLKSYQCRSCDFRTTHLKGLKGIISSSVKSVCFGKYFNVLFFVCHPNLHKPNLHVINLIYLTLGSLFSKQIHTDTLRDLWVISKCRSLIQIS